MSLAVVMVGAIMGLLGAYVVTSIILTRRPTILHKRKKNVIYAVHISHRGGAGERIENTMPAFQRAMSLSTDMLELDCHLLFDGDVVVSHDLELSRLTDVHANVSDFTISTLPLIKDRLQLTFSPDAYISSSQPQERSFVLLEDVFKSFPSVAINIDIKVDDDILISKVNEMVCKYGREHITIWGNRSDTICKKCYNTNPNIGMMFSQRRILETVALFYFGLLPFFPIREGYFEIPMLRIFLEPEFKVFGFKWYWRFVVWIFDKLLMSPVLLRHLRERGISTFVWVCNKESHFREAFEMGAAGVMTDYPTLLRSFLDNNPKYKSAGITETIPLVSHEGDIRPITKGK